MNKQIYSELLAQGNYLRLSKRLIAVLGLEMAVFMSFLIDKYDYYSNNNLLNEDSFYFTDNDILIFRGLNANKIQKLKIEGKKLELFSIKKMGNPSKTYYSINFDTLNHIFMQKKSIEDLAYERIFQEKIDVDNLNYETLNTLSRKELQLLCKNQKIKYFGHYTKKELIENILQTIIGVNKNISNNIFENINEKTFKELREICKSLNISYTGKDNKQILIEKISSKKEVDNSVTKKIGNKCAKKLVTSYQKNWTNQEQILTSKKQEQSHDHDMSDFEILFKEFEINFTTKNQNSVQDLLKNMSKKEVIDYLEETYNNIKSNPNVRDVPAFFSEKISKGELQEPFIQKELTIEKKNWLNRYSGIISDQTLKKDIEKIILDIPFDTLEKNKSKLSTISIFEFKKYLYFLKNESKVS
mgnify:FL=1